ncbi:MAG: hypothetical protein A2857_03055 [Candidatus Levybacteria bacterium RIFCSPHIGHO2_01_FULL_36_15]|nr:MAG: hypothetical protein A2857_03055 [Candidatus Levybacteria bacterium RIFCSPHIGHO2_01_FULL_36_15]
MLFYQITTLLLLFFLPFVPKQLDVAIIYVIIFYTALIMPVFLRRIAQIFWPIRKNAFFNNPSILFFILLLIFGFISLIFSVDQQRSVLQMALLICYFIIFVSIGGIFKNALFPAFTLFAGSIALGLIALYNTFYAQVVNKGSEGVSFLWIYYGHNHLSALLLFSIPIGLYLVKRYSGKNSLISSIFASLVLLLIFSLFTTFARASILSLFIAFCVSSLIFLKSSKLKIAALSVMILLAVSTVFTTNISLEQARKIGVKKFELSFQTRILYWAQTIEIFAKKPLTGFGLDTYKTVSFQNQPPPLMTYYAHNFFLQILSDTGIFGYLASLALMFSVLGQGYKHIKCEILNFKYRDQALLLLALGIGIFASMLNNLVDFDFMLPTVSFIFWTMAGILTYNTKYSG